MVGFVAFVREVASLIDWDVVCDKWREIVEFCPLLPPGF